jgi:hypothetical protein
MIDFSIYAASSLLKTVNKWDRRIISMDGIARFFWEFHALAFKARL